MLAKIERSVFFPIVRVFAFIVAFFLLLAIVGTFIYIATYDARQSSKLRVSFFDVVNKVSPEGTATASQTARPENVERHFSSDSNRLVLERWLGEFPTDSAKKDFLENMSLIISEAERHDPEKVSDYINQYHSVKMEKINEGGIDIMGTKINISQYLEPLIRVANIGAALSAILFMFALFTLVILLLLLLSIERNTRKEP